MYTFARLKGWNLGVMGGFVCKGENARVRMLKANVKGERMKVDS